jgi:hypothetical protein
MEYIAVLEGLNGLQFSQRQSRKSLGSNSRSSVGSTRQSVDCSPCVYEAAAPCGYEAAAVCGYEAAVDCSYEAAPACGYEGSFDCNAGCVETIPAYVPPPQVFVPQQPVPQLQPVPQQAVQPTPSFVPMTTPGAPATVQYQLVPTYLPAPGVVVTVADCGPRSVRNPDGSCSELQGLNVASVKGTLGRLGKVFGK